MDENAESPLQSLMKRQLNWLTLKIKQQGDVAYASQSFCDDFQQYSLPIKPIESNPLALLLVARNDDKGIVATHIQQLLKGKKQKVAPAVRIISIPYTFEETKDFYDDYSLTFAQDDAPFYIHSTYHPNMFQFKLDFESLQQPDWISWYTKKFLVNTLISAKNIIAKGKLACQILQGIDQSESSEYDYMFIFDRSCDQMPLILTGQSYLEQLSLHGLQFPNNDLSLRTHHLNTDEIGEFVKNEKQRLEDSTPKAPDAKVPAAEMTKIFQLTVENNKQRDAFLAFHEARQALGKKRNYHHVEMLTLKRDIYQRSVQSDYVADAIISGQYSLAQAWQLAACCVLFDVKVNVKQFVQVLTVTFGRDGATAGQKLSEFSQDLEVLKKYNCFSTEMKTTGKYAQYEFYQPLLTQMVEKLLQNDLQFILGDPIQSESKLSPNKKCEKILIVVIGVMTHSETASLQFLRTYCQIDVVCAAVVNGERGVRIGICE